MRPRPHHADGLAEDLGAGERRPLPGAFTQRRVGGRDLARRGQHQRQRVLGGAVNIRRGRVDHQHTARGGGVDVDVVQADAGAGDDLELGRGGQHLGVDGGRRAHQQRVGVGHGGQQLFAVRAVDPADLYLVTEGGNGGLGKFVGNQYYGKTHATSVMGLNCGVDVTVVGSGPNGLAAAVICARAGLTVRVVEAQPTPGGGARSAPDPEFPGVLHDICSAVHPLGVASPFFAEFDLAARGVDLVAPEVSYANPLPDRPAAVAYRSLERTCAELDDGASWRRLFGPLTDHVDGVLGFFLGDKRSLPPDLLTTVRTGLRVLTQGSPAWGLLRGEDARALFTGVGVHAISTMPSPVNSGAGLMLGTVAHTAGWPVPVGGTQVISDALIADLRAHGGELVLGEPVTAPPDGVVIYDTAPTALLDIYGDAVPSTICKGVAPLPIRPGRVQGRLRAVRRHPVARRARRAGADGAHGRNAGRRWLWPNGRSRPDATPSGR